MWKSSPLLSANALALFKLILLRLALPLWVQYLQSALAVISVCQIAANWSSTINNHYDPAYQDYVLSDHLQQLDSALLFCVDALEHVLRHISRMDLISILMHRIMWLKLWAAETPCKTRLTTMLF